MKIPFYNCHCHKFSVEYEKKELIGINVQKYEWYDNIIQCGTFLKLSQSWHFMNRVLRKVLKNGMTILHHMVIK